MKLHELIQRNHWLSVKLTLLKIEPELESVIDAYERIYGEIGVLEPKESSIILMIDRHWEEGEPTIHAHAYGYDSTIPNSEPTRGLALEWVSWSKWLGFTLDRDAIDEWTEHEMISHSLIEMTLDGLTQEEIQETRNKIIFSVKEIKMEYFNNKLDK
ncbi:MAG: hypothetical protein IPL46_26675 [Saprospiraceae bacterium]|nr:hypothetical protein [Saprospiraceae bacterium]